MATLHHCVLSHQFNALRILIYSVLLTYSAMNTRHFGVEATALNFTGSDSTIDNMPTNSLSQCFNESNTTNCNETDFEDTLDRDVIRLLSLSPCDTLLFTNNNSELHDQLHSKFINWRAILRECDILSYAAAKLAQERINFKFSELRAELELVPIETGMVSETLHEYLM